MRLAIVYYQTKHKHQSMTKLSNTELINIITSIDGIEEDVKVQLIKALNEKKKYGLVWEDKPEDIENLLKEHLPVLSEVKERALTSGGEDAPNHILIEGDNLAALTALSYTHEGKVDVIYIDPPYNTGNKDFVYNDSFVDLEDGYRHSKWLSFMHKRLQIAKRLLSDKGVILISIDDNEQANLKLLCDEVFGNNNFIATMIWRGGRRNMAKWISTSHEYMLLYANNLSYCSDTKVEWNEKKQGLTEIYNAAKKFVKDCDGNYEKASALLKSWYKNLPETSPSKDHSHYCWIDKKGVYFASDISRGGGGGPKWEIKNPYTHEIVQTPSRGWAYPSLEDMLQDIENDKIHFNGAGVPCKKIYLKEHETQILETVFYKDRRGSSKRLRELLGSDAFPFPKDEEVLCDKLESFSDKNSIILDFFAGSGTTLHSTILLNQKDNGNRQCILVTNNENNICEEITYERNKRVIQGYTTTKGVPVEGYANNNLRYYKAEFLPREYSNEAKRGLMRAAAEMLCIKENIYTEIREFCGMKFKPSILRYFKDDDGRQMLLVFDERAIQHIVPLIEKSTGSFKVYVFSNGAYAYDDEFVSVRERVELCALPEAILQVYNNVLPQNEKEVRI